MTPPSDRLERDADGFAVLMKDTESSPRGFWFVGAYLSKDAADDVAKKQGKNCSVHPFVLGKCQSCRETERTFDWCRQTTCRAEQRAEAAEAVVERVRQVAAECDGIEGLGSAAIAQRLRAAFAPYLASVEGEAGGSGG